MCDFKISGKFIRVVRRTILNICMSGFCINGVLLSMRIAVDRTEYYRAVLG